MLAASVTSSPSAAKNGSLSSSQPQPQPQSQCQSQPPPPSSHLSLPQASSSSPLLLSPLSDQSVRHEEIMEPVADLGRPRPPPARAPPAIPRPRSKSPSPLCSDSPSPSPSPSLVKTPLPTCKPAMPPRRPRALTDENVYAHHGVDLLLATTHNQRKADTPTTVQTPIPSSTLGSEISLSGRNSLPSPASHFSPPTSPTLVRRPLRPVSQLIPTMVVHSAPPNKPQPSLPQGPRFPETPTATKPNQYPSDNQERNGNIIVASSDRPPVRLPPKAPVSSTEATPNVAIELQHQLQQQQEGTSLSENENPGVTADVPPDSGKQTAVPSVSKPPRKPLPSPTPQDTTHSLQPPPSKPALPSREGRRTLIIPREVQDEIKQQIARPVSMCISSNSGTSMTFNNLNPQDLESKAEKPAEPCKSNPSEMQNNIANSLVKEVAASTATIAHALEQTEPRSEEEATEISAPPPPPAPIVSDTDGSGIVMTPTGITPYFQPTRISGASHADSRKICLYNAISELYYTEKSYKEDLEVIINEYFKPLTASKIISERNMRNLFSNLLDIYEVTKEVEAVMDEEMSSLTLENFFIPKIGKIFRDASEDLCRVYSIYCGNQSVFRRTCHLLCEDNPTVKEFLKLCRLVPACKNLDLPGFLIKPVQRICKYPLLIREIKKYIDQSEPEFSNLCEAEDKVKRILDEVNTKVSEQDEIETFKNNGDKPLEELDALFGDSSVIRTGTITQTKKGRTTEVTAYLLSNYKFLFSPVCPNKKSKLYALDLTKSSLRDNPTHSSNGFVVEEKRKYKFSWPLEKYAGYLIWMEDIKHTISAAKKS
ncbi:actin cortical patch component, with ef hand and wh2 motif panl [Pelomyxa schiedti]|nr:actin cortical patch component, with ef hand and wh2 motif panl [Pelomyxa schiedti]